MIHKDLYERNTNIAHAIMESVFRDYTLCFQGLHTLFSGITHSAMILLIIKHLIIFHRSVVY